MSNVATMHSPAPRTSNRPTRDAKTFTRPSQAAPKTAPKKKEHTSLFNVLPQNVTRGKGVCEGLDVAERGYLSALISICGDEGACFYTLTNLALELGMSVSTIYRYNRKLKTRNLITIEKKSNQTLCIRVCMKMIWQNNEKVCPIPPKKKSCFFDPNSPSNRPDPQSNRPDPTTPSRAQTPVSLTDRERVSFSNDKREGEGSNPTESHNPTDQLSETPAASDISLENNTSEETPQEEKVYPENIKRIAAEVSKESLLPVTPALLDFLAFFTAKHPQIDVVEAALDARLYAEEKLNHKLDFLFYKGTCDRWVKLKSNNTFSSSSRQHQECSSGSSLNVADPAFYPPVPSPEPEIVPSMTEEEAEALVQDIHKQASTYGYSITATSVKSAKFEAWLVRVVWTNRYGLKPPAKLKSRKEWEQQFNEIHAYLQKGR